MVPAPTPDDVDGFPTEARWAFERLLDLDLQPRSSLADQVERHLVDLEEVQDEVLDLTTARELARTSHRLLALYPEAPEPDRRLIQAAVLYFVLDQDALPDRRSRTGLEDDARVLRAVAAHLDRRSDR